ncbi:MAG: PD40 domain-containing protein [Anaerolineales bacterium]|nr:MAG: PD40 domain-containing protein [Anaerolineales bacterium]
MLKFKPSQFLAILFSLLLAACMPGNVSTADQVATSVAATLEAGGQPVPTAGPTLGEVATQAPTEPACANAGLINVAYVKDGDVWLWVEGGMRTQLTAFGDVLDLAISEDGCRIAYTRSLPNPMHDPAVEFVAPETLSELWVVSSDGATSHALVDTAYLAAQPVPAGDNIVSVSRFEFQPRSHTLAFNTQMLHPGVGLTLRNDINLINVDSGELVTLLGVEQAGGNFAFSPDGSQVAFSTPTSIGVINTDGSFLRRDLITYPMVITYSEYLYSPPLAWSADGNSLMVAIPPADGLAEGAPETALWWIPLDGTPAFEAGSVQAAFFVMGEVAFSPDAGRIAYLRPIGDPGSGMNELVVALSDGSNESPVISDPQAYFLAWSPDNSRYLYAYMDSGLRLALATAADSTTTLLASLAGSSPFALRAEWVDASRFLLLEQGEATRLSLMDATGLAEVIDTFATPFVSFAAAP